MIKTKIENYLKKVIYKTLIGADFKLINTDFKIEVFTSEKDNFGHYSTNAALKLAKELKKNPMQIAEEIKILLLSDRIARDYFEKIEIAAPGFINFWLTEKVLQDELKEILKQKNNYGQSKIKGQKSKVQIEYISANPTGPLTLANGRGGFMGDVLSNILEFCGYKVEREYYVNDAGNQILTLGKSILANAGFLAFEEKFYKGGYVKEWAIKNSLKVKKFKNNPMNPQLMYKWGMKVGKMAAANFLKEIKSVVKKAGINFNRWTSEEKDIYKKSFTSKALNIFKKAKLIYEKDGALWLKTTDFGDEKDRVLITRDGFPTYFLADSGHYLETKKRGFNKKIIILGPDHHGYIKRIQAAAKIIGLKDSDVIITQAIRLISKGKEVKMSKRSGEFVTFEELIKEVSIDAARFFFLMHSADTHMDFDLDLAKEWSMKNPVYYVQYAAVRCGSILRKSQISNPKSQINSKFKIQNLNLLDTLEDINLMRMLARFPEIIKEAGEKYNPQILARYSLELAWQFNNFYEKERVIGEEKNLAAARLELIKATQIIFKILFSVLGISLPRRM
ncbi:arginine--tRNA ligase [Candidatus Wolfebacteria bacterium CG02_land_8_20_14_3_00_37_12]|uniref:Arginine--tRNA ligase n=1 Tax=Candidatus Wolfebacteria bacterium CG02_land_8_20_14_3_00_37_12 TaxID=1975066 RepID=A0A2M7CQD6_9BACT|nr:MAG: arginine--tRNA ligase [Candidatus Wolfebacteria bacterium CG02_land_8_20_14_3_00_37_12]